MSKNMWWATRPPVIILSAGHSCFDPGAKWEDITEHDLMARLSLYAHAAMVPEKLANMPIILTVPPTHLAEKIKTVNRWSNVLEQNGFVLGRRWRSALRNCASILDGLTSISPHNHVALSARLQNSPLNS